MDDKIKVKYLYSCCKSFELYMTERFKNTTTKELLECYNGTGAEWMPSSIREALDTVFQPFLPAVLEHDFNFWFENDNQEATFKAHNERFYENCIKLANIYGTNIVTRWWKRRKARVLYIAVRDFGWSAYTNAFEQRLLEDDK